MNIKKFLKPTKSKVVIFVIIGILANIPYVGYFIVTTSCFSVNEIPIPCINFVNVFNPVLNPIFWLWGGEDDMPLATIYYSGTGKYYVLMALNIVYWYLFSCFIIRIYDKYFKKVKKK